jgi:hypothetical protein
MKRLLIVLLVMSWSMSSFAADRVRQLLPNGDFEQGSAIWSTQGVWVAFDNYTRDAHSGTWYVELEDWINGFAAISQQVTVPRGSPMLQFWVATNSSSVCGDDYFQVFVGGQLVMQITLCESTNRWYEMQSVDVSKWEGQTVDITLGGVWGGADYATDVLVDDVYFEFDAPAPLIFEDSFEDKTN